jgi:WD40 repeat protein
LARKVRDGTPLDLATRGELLAGIASDGHFVINQNDGRELFAQTFVPPTGWKDDLEFAGVAVAPGKLLIGQYGKLEFWDTNSKQRLVSIVVEPATTLSVAIDPLGKYIASGYLPPWIRTQSATPPPPDSPAVDYSHVPVLWSVPEGKPVLFVDLRPGQSGGKTSERAPSNQPDAPVSSSKSWLVPGVAFSPDGKNLVITKAGPEPGAGGGIDLYVRNEAADGPPFVKSVLPSWDPASQTAATTAATKRSFFATFWGEEASLAVSQDNGTLIFSRGQAPRQIVMNEGVPRIAISPDNSLLAAMSYEGVTLWDLDRGTQFGSMIKTVSINAPLGVAFSSDNRRLFMADSSPKSLVSFDLDVQSWIKQACEIAGRELTSSERLTYQLPTDGKNSCSAEKADGRPVTRN